VITHVVMMKLREADQALEVRRRLEALPAQIPEIKSYQVGLDELHGPRAWHVVLLSAFDDVAALQTYVAHPAHQDVVAFLDRVCETRASVDFTV
jgi:hypothetical protein